MKCKMKKIGKPVGATFGLLGAMAAIWWFALRPHRLKDHSAADE